MVVKVLKHVCRAYMVLVAIILLIGIVTIPSAYIKNQDLSSISVASSVQPCHNCQGDGEKNAVRGYGGIGHDHWKIAFNCHVRAEGMGDCSVLLLKQLPGNEVYSAKIMRLCFSSNSEVYVGDWHHVGRGAVNIVGYEGSYEFNAVTHTYTIDGNASVCFARIVE